MVKRFDLDSAHIYDAEETSVVLVTAFCVVEATEIKRGLHAQAPPFTPRLRPPHPGSTLHVSYL